DLGLVNRFDVRTGATEVDRILSCAPGNEPRKGSAIHAECRIRALCLARARNHLLHHDQAWVNQRARFVIASEERLTILYPPGFVVDKAVEALLDRRFEDDWKSAVERGDLLATDRVARPGVIDA